MSEQQPSQRGVEPSGVMEDNGDFYYTKEDITTGKGKSRACRIKHLPVGNIPLLLSACDESTNTTEYDGGDVPIFARVDDDGHRFYKCKHVMQEADKKKGRKIAICNTTFHDSNSSNIGSIIGPRGPGKMQQSGVRGTG
eukprot:scaffold16711_cov94-Skeletonema_marinoi.AAC.1